MTIWTVGHSNRTQAAFLALLAQSGIALVADVRAFPRSRTNPQFNADVLEAALPDAGIGYVHLPELGGRRASRKDAAGSPNTLWREPGFRNYADYALTPPFRAGFAELMRLAAERRTAVMCAEAVWWRCHRRLIADYLLAAGVPVMHILSEDRVEAAALSDGARVADDGRITYPGPQGDLFAPPD